MEKNTDKAAGNGEKMLRKNFLGGIIFVIVLLIVASLGLRDSDGTLLREQAS